jgi:hypothetical protein
MELTDRSEALNRAPRAHNPREALKAKVLLRNLIVDGRIKLCPSEDGSLWAGYSMSPATRLKGWWLSSLIRG